MSLSCGIVGIPNIGKSTIFNALTGNNVAMENYPFCTVGPNIGKINIPNKNLFTLAKLLNTDKAIPATMQLIDIAGLIRGAHQGEGLGNQFLGHIRQVDAIIHILRTFDDPNIIHVDGSIDPLRDKETTELELIFADLEIIENELTKIPNYLKSKDKKIVEQTKRSIPILEKLKSTLEQGYLASTSTLDNIDLESIDNLNLITLKPILYLCNINDTPKSKTNSRSVKEWAIKNNHLVLEIDCSLEAELNSLKINEKKQFLIDMGLKESGCNKLIKESYRLLNLITFFTNNINEVKAWEIPQGTSAQKAAEKIHTDMAKGFIRAEIISSNDLIEIKSIEKIKKSGKLKIEGKNYCLSDGDIMKVRFNI